MKILGLSGSLRADSSNHAVLRAIAQLGQPIEIHDGLARLPHFSPDLDVEPAPAEVARLRAAVRSADALVVSSPEYAHGIPGSLKNALDWMVSSGELTDKPVLVWSASPSGAEFMHPQLIEVLRVMGGKVLLEGALRITSARRAFDAGGRLIDAGLEAQLRASLAALAATS